MFIFSGGELSGRGVGANRQRAPIRRICIRRRCAWSRLTWCLGAMAFLWALMVLMTKFPDIAQGKMRQREEPGRPSHVRLLQPHFVLAVLAQFLYVGAQVGTWSYFIHYVRSATGVGDKAAGYMLTGTLAAFAVGRFSSAWLMRHFHARPMLGVYAVINVVLVSGCCGAARMGGRRLLAHHEPVHVDYVPDYLCAGP